MHCLLLYRNAHNVCFHFLSVPVEAYDLCMGIFLCIFLIIFDQLRQIFTSDNIRLKSRHSSSIDNGIAEAVYRDFRGFLPRILVA